MTKTAAIILNHNLPDYTDMLFDSLKPYEREDYDLMVFDNGSTPEGTSKHTTHKNEENLYFGGGLNAAMQLVLEDDQYDSLLFLSNDLTIHPYQFVKILRQEMFREVFEDSKSYAEIRFDIVAPAFYNIEPNQQCHWKTMHSYGAPYAREVPFVDFQCPLISKRLLKEIGSIDPDLIYGWGPDAFFSIKCTQLGWKMGVSDRNCILHHNSLTVKKGVAGLTIQEYCRKAEEGQAKFFTKNNLIKEFQEVRHLGQTYTYTSK